VRTQECQGTAIASLPEEPIRLIAQELGTTLLTLDRRATRTCELLGVDYRVVVI